MPVAEKHHRGRNGPRGWLAAVGGPILVLAITIAFYWRLVLSDQYTWLTGPDTANQVLPWFQYQAAEWHRGRLALWEPYQGIGQSLIGQAQPGTAYPLNWILFSLPLDNGWIRQVYLHWYFVLTRFLAALFCYWLCRDLKRSRPASILAGVIFSLGGYIGFTDWPQMVNGAIWAPLVFLFMIRALRGRRPVASAALAGMFLGVSWLSGHHQIPVFLTLVVTAVWAWHILRRLPPTWSALGSATLFYVFAVLTSAFQVLPAFEYGRLALRWVSAPEPVGWNDPVPYIVHTNFSLEPGRVLGIIVPGMSLHGALFVGLVAVSLALAAVVTALRSPIVRLFALTATGGLLLALGAYSVLHGVLYAVAPMVEKARVPHAAALILHFGIAILSACGIDYLTSNVRAPALRCLSLCLAFTGTALYLLVLALWVFKEHATDSALALTALVSVLAAALLGARARGFISRQATGILCIVLVLTELGSAQVGWHAHRSEVERNRYLMKLTQFADVIGFLKRQAWPVRVDFDEGVIPFNLGDWHGIDTLPTLGASMPAKLVAMSPHSERTHALLGVAYEIRAAPWRREQQLLFKGADGANVYHNPGAFPRVWAVHEVLRLEKPSEVGQRLSDPTFDPARKAFVVGEPTPAVEPAAGTDQVRLARREPEAVTIEAHMGSKGMVILSDAFYPGWKATLDARPVTIHEVYGGLRGVVTPAGRHVIEMRYRPLSVYAGGIMTLAGILGACALAGWGPRRRVLG